MGDRVQLPMQENQSQYIITHPGQHSLAIPSWVGAMSGVQTLRTQDTSAPVPKCP